MSKELGEWGTIKVKCIKLKKQHDDGSISDGWLTIGRDYDVLEMFFHPQQGTVLRMIGNEPSTPGLFSGDLFDVIDSRVPRNWVVVKNKHGMHLLP